MKRVVFYGGLVVAVAIVICLRAGGRAPRTSGPLTNDAYVWQRAWTEPVQTAVRNLGSNFAEIVGLGAEVAWRHGHPTVVTVEPDFGALGGSCRSVGLALRIGPYQGRFSRTDETASFLSELAASLIASLRTNQINPAELQIDFDCAESKLDGYILWLEAVKTRIAPVRLTITALPAWLKHASFERLAKVTDGYVLQVHSLRAPRDSSSPFTLCDTGFAKRAVERAAKAGVPFRVALPTYGYLVAFDRQGRFVGLSAEGPARSWPEGVTVKEVRSDPAAMAALVRIWSADRPRALTGLIWYRLPIAEENLNWPWPTLSMVMAAQVPQSDVRAVARYPEPALVEIDLINSGQSGHSSPVQVALRWQTARRLAGDALLGFDLVESGEGAVEFRSRTNWAGLRPGERRNIGWVRFNQEVEVQIEVSNL